MKQHFQTITGAASSNSGRPFSIGIISGVSYVIYAAGFDLIVLDSEFKKVFSIKCSSQITCLSVSNCCQICIINESDVYFYEPEIENGIVRWIECGTHTPKNRPHFSVWYSEDSVLLAHDHLELCCKSSDGKWLTVWSTSLPIHITSISTCGRLFATCSHDEDRLLRVWYPKEISNVIDFGYLYLAHPKAVQSFSWRRSLHDFTRFDAVSALITSCADGVTRLWLQTSLNTFSKTSPSDSTDSMSSNSTTTADQSQRISRVDMAKHAADNFIKRYQRDSSVSEEENQNWHSLSKLKSNFFTCTQHMHFHLASSITQNDVSNMCQEGTNLSGDLRVHWVNNKHLQLKQSVDQLERVVFDETTSKSSDVKEVLKCEAVNANINIIRRSFSKFVSNWFDSSDLLMAIHPKSGSLLLWRVEFIDYDGGFQTRISHRQTKITFVTRLSSVFSFGDASTLDTRFGPAIFLDTPKKFSENEVTSSCESSTVKMVTHHSESGSLNLWTVRFDSSKSVHDDTAEHPTDVVKCKINACSENFSHVVAVKHTARAQGHTTQKIERLIPHPTLPILVSVASSTLGVNNCKYELIVWRVDGSCDQSTLHCGNLTELCRLNDQSEKDNENDVSPTIQDVSWLPHSIPCTSDSCGSACLLVCNSDNTIHVYHVVIDARLILQLLSTKSLFRIVSTQSSSRPGVILKVGSIKTPTSPIKTDHKHSKMFTFSKSFIDNQNSISCDHELFASHLNVPSDHEIDKMSISSTVVFYVVKGDFDGRDDGCGGSDEFNVTRVAVDFCSFDSDVIEYEMSDEVVCRSFSFDSTENVLIGVDCVNSMLYSNLTPTYALVTSHADNEVKFWQIKSSKVDDNASKEQLSFREMDVNFVLDIESYTLLSVHVSPTPGRCAVLARNQKNEKLCVSMLECESSGGEEWIVERTFQTEILISHTFDWFVSGDTYLFCLPFENKIMCYSSTEERVYEPLQILCSRQKCPTDVDKFTWIADNNMLVFSSKSSSPTSEVSESAELYVFPKQTLSVVSKSIVDVSNDVTNPATNDDVAHFNLVTSCDLVGAKTCGMNNGRWTGVLPQYHPDQLMELLSAGKFNWVRRILNHLVRSLQRRSRRDSNFSSSKSGRNQSSELECSDRETEDVDGVFDDIESTSAAGHWRRSRTFSVSVMRKDSIMSAGHDHSERHAIHESLLLDYLELDNIPPLPLHRLLAPPSSSTSSKGGSSDDQNVHHSDEVQCKAGDTKYEDLFGNSGEANSSSIDDEEPSFDVIGEEGGDGRKSASNSEKRGSRGKKKRNISFRDNTTSRSVNSNSFSVDEYEFNSEMSDVLSSLLTHTHLPGLTSVEQMRLLAVADTIASADNHHADLPSRFDAKHSMMDSNSVMRNRSSKDESCTSLMKCLDDCGLRFVLAMRHHSYLLRCLPPAQRAQFAESGIPARDLVWGFHSESELELIGLIPHHHHHQQQTVSNLSQSSNSLLTWPDLRQYGVAWWLRSPVLLRSLIEDVAKNVFKVSQDPLDAAVFYLAMKKKNLLWGLYRSLRDEKMTSFFANNFGEERWRRAALKNAFALLGKQRFLHATAFFLLAGSVSDAVDICIDKLHDFQLAIVITRLYDGTSNITSSCESNSNLKALLEKYIIPSNEDKSERGSLIHLAENPYLRSIALWNTKRYEDSLKTFIMDSNCTRNSMSNGIDIDLDASKMTSNRRKFDYSAFNFYIYLRTHPLLLKAEKNVSNSDQFGSKSCKDQAIVDNQIDDRRLYFETAHHYTSVMKCPMLALEVYGKLTPPKEVSPKSEGTTSRTSESSNKTLLKMQKSIDTGTLDFFGSSTAVGASKPTPFDALAESSTTEEVDWSKPVASLDNDELKLDWSDGSDDTSSDDSFNESSAHQKGADSDAVEGDVSKVTDEEAKDSVKGLVDLSAQHLKFMSCLTLMLEEMTSIPSTATSERHVKHKRSQSTGLLLRKTIHNWLEKTIDEICNVCNFPKSDKHLITSSKLKLRSEADSTQANDFYSIQLEWIKYHEPLLRALLKFCNISSNRRQVSTSSNDTEEVVALDSSASGVGGGGVGTSLPAEYSSNCGLACVRIEIMILLQKLHSSSRNCSGNDENEKLPPLFNGLTSLYRGGGRGSVVVSPLASDDEKCITNSSDAIVLHLRCVTQTIIDLLSEQTFLKEDDFSPVFNLKDLASNLSASLFQVLTTSSSSDDQSVCPSINFSRDHVEFANPNIWPGLTVYENCADSATTTSEPMRLKLKFSSVRILLCEIYISIYVGMLYFALKTSDAQLLYRLIGQAVSVDRFNWYGSIFGGATLKKEPNHSTTAPTAPTVRKPSIIRIPSLRRKPVQASNPSPPVRPPPPVSTSGSKVSKSSSYDLHSNDIFLSPSLSIMENILMKPKLKASQYATGCSTPPGDSCWWLEYDSGNESDDNKELGDDEDDENEFSDTEDNMFSDKDNDKANDGQTADSSAEEDSFAWTLIKLGCLSVAKNCVIIKVIQHLVGCKIQDIGMFSPMIHEYITLMDKWMNELQSHLNNDLLPSRPENFLRVKFDEDIEIADSGAEVMPRGATIDKYPNLFIKNVTPFSMGRRRGSNVDVIGLKSVRRLWLHLVRQPQIQPIFIRFIYGNKIEKTTEDIDEKESKAASLSNNSSALNSATGSPVHHQGCRSGEDNYGEINRFITADVVKVVQRESNALSSFCLDEGGIHVGQGRMSVASGKEIQELDISMMLDERVWKNSAALISDPAEFDASNLKTNKESRFLSAINLPYLVVSSPSDKFSMADKIQYEADQENKKSAAVSLMKKHKVDGVRRLACHPQVPSYLCGNQDGSVRLFSWNDCLNYDQSLVIRPGGVFGKVNKIQFNNPFGNKFGICDSDGQVALWQFENVNHQPYLTLQCNSKHTFDFTFLSRSSSVIATAGLSSADLHNVAIWDTMMPTRRCQVGAFPNAHPHGGASSIVSIPAAGGGLSSASPLLVTGGKKGGICIWDWRMCGLPSNVGSSPSLARHLVHSYKGHDSVIKTLAVSNPSENFPLSFASGSSSGEIKIWSASTFECLATFTDHMPHNMGGGSPSSGVMTPTTTAHQSKQQMGSGGGGGGGSSSSGVGGGGGVAGVLKTMTQTNQHSIVQLHFDSENRLWSSSSSDGILKVRKLYFDY